MNETETDVTRTLSLPPDDPRTPLIWRFRVLVEKPPGSRFVEGEPFYVSNDKPIWSWIGSHADYDTFLS